MGIKYTYLALLFARFYGRAFVGCEIGWGGGENGRERKREVDRMYLFAYLVCLVRVNVRRVCDVMFEGLFRKVVLEG